MSLRVLSISLIMVFLLMASSTSAVYAQQPYVAESLTVTVYPDGIVHIEYTLTVDPTYPEIQVTIFGQTPENLMTSSGDGIPLDYSLTDRILTIDTLGSNKTIISYDTADLTSKAGRIWTLSLEAPLNTAVILPAEATIISLNRVPVAVESREGQTVVVMPEGKIEIDYVVGIVGTREHAAILIREAEQTILEAENAGVIVADAEAKLQQAKEAFNAENYPQAENLAGQAKVLTIQKVEAAGKAKAMIGEAEKAVSKARSEDVVVAEAEAKLKQAKELFDAGSYGDAEQLASRVKSLAEEAIKNASIASTIISNASDAIAKAKNEGRTVGLGEAERFLKQAQTAYGEGDYQRAMELAGQAKVKAEAAELPPKPAPPAIIWILAVAVAVIIGVVVYLIVRKRKKASIATVPKERRLIDAEKIFQEHPQLRPDDKEAVDFIIEAGGEVFESELREKFKLPRTTTWRMVKRLKSEGIVEIQKIRGQNLVRIRPRYEMKT